MSANHSAAGTVVTGVSDGRVDGRNDDVFAVRAFLAAGRGRRDRPAATGTPQRNPAGAARGRRPTLDLPCRRHDPALWFAEAPAELERAKALCAHCPIRLACLAIAVDRAEFAGVWGGHIFDRGRIVAHKRPRGRPRKHQSRRVASPERGASAPEEKMMTPAMPAGLPHGPDMVRAAAARLYDAECALHNAHQSHVDAWIDMANRSLHAAVTDYLAVATSQPDRQHVQTSAR